LPLISDLRNDSRLCRNIIIVAVFLALFIVLDLAASAILLRGTERFYGLGSDADIVMIGHSHLMLAVDKVALGEQTGLKVAKYTREGVNTADRKVMAEQFFGNAAETPEVVILSIDPWLFSGEGLSLNSWKLFLPFMNNREVDSYIMNSAGRRFDYLRYKYIRTSRFNAQLLNASARGWLSNWDNLKYGVIDTSRYSDEESLRAFRPITFDRGLMDDFAATLDFLNDQRARVLLLNTPVWGPLVRANQSGYDRAMLVIDSIAGIHCPDAEIIDLVPQFSGRTELFFDLIHMNPEGQREVTAALSSRLQVSLPEAENRLLNE